MEKTVKKFLLITALFLKTATYCSGPEPSIFEGPESGLNLVLGLGLAGLAATTVGALATQLLINDEHENKKIDLDKIQKLEAVRNLIAVGGVGLVVFLRALATRETDQN